MEGIFTQPWLTGILLSYMDIRSMRAATEAWGSNLREVLYEVNIAPSLLKQFLVLASAAGDIDLVQLFLNRGMVLSNGWEPSIIAAARHGHILVVEKLMNHRKQKDPHKWADNLVRSIRPVGKLTASQLKSLLVRCLVNNPAPPHPSSSLPDPTPQISIETRNPHFKGCLVCHTQWLTQDPHLQKRCKCGRCT